MYHTHAINYVSHTCHISNMCCSLTRPNAVHIHIGLHVIRIYTLLQSCFVCCFALIPLIRHMAAHIGLHTYRDHIHTVLRMVTLTPSGGFVHGILCSDTCDNWRRNSDDGYNIPFIQLLNNTQSPNNPAGATARTAIRLPRDKHIYIYRVYVDSHSLGQLALASKRIS